MTIIGISGYKSYIGNHFYQKNKKKIRIIHYKKDINNMAELKKYIIPNWFEEYHKLFTAGIEYEIGFWESAWNYSTNSDERSEQF